MEMLDIENAVVNEIFFAQRIDDEVQANKKVSVNDDDSQWGI